MEENIKNKKGETSSFIKISICLALLFTVFLPIKEFILNNSNEVLAYTKEECRYLSDIPYVTGQSSVGWGSITLDKNLETKYNNGLITLMIDGEQKSFKKGVSAHATSTLVYDISSYNLDYFTAYIGVDASRGKNGNGVKFSIYTSVDGTNWDLKTAENPQVMKGNTNAELVNIDIKGAKYLKLCANNNGNADADHSVYADAKLIKEGFVFEEKELNFIKTVEEYDEIIKAHDGEEITGEYELALLQREFVKNVGYDYLVLIAQDDDIEEMLLWLMTNIENIRMYILGGKPDGGSYANSLTQLARLYDAYKDDFTKTENLNNPWYPEMTNGDLYKKMAISLSLTHSTAVGYWAQINHPSNRSDALERYRIYKYLHDNGKFVVSSRQDQTPWFEALQVEEMRYVMNNITDDEELIWLNEYTQKRIDAHPNQEEKYLQPHTYIAYVWPNYQNPIFHDPARKDYWDEKFEGIFSKYGVTYSSGDDIVYKAWMTMRNEFGTGAVCGGISKLGTHIRAAHGTPASVISQPGHAAIIYYRKDNAGNGYWSMDNGVNGWERSGKTEKLGTRMPLGWGSDSYVKGYAASYIVLAQEALNHNEDYEKSEKLIMCADVYSEKREEYLRKALDVLPYNVDAWWELIKLYQANTETTEEQYLELATEMAEALKAFPLPMYNLTNLLKNNLTSPEYSFAFSLLQTRILTEGSNATAQTMNVYQPSITKTVASYLLGEMDTTLATFSFDGENAGKIVLASRFDNSGVRWDYCINGDVQNPDSWKEVSFSADEEHKWLLTPEEVDSLTSENDIYVHMVGVNYDEENLYKIDILEQQLPGTVYNNDWENKVVGITDTVEWRMDGSDEWKLFSEATPDLTGDKTIVVRSRRTGVYLMSGEKTLTFTADTDTPERKYIPIANLSIHAVSSEATGNGGHAANAIDGNYNTRWHSAWNGSDTQKYITIKFEKPIVLSAMEYFPIATGGNGIILSGQIYGSMDGINFDLIDNVTWANNGNVKALEVADRPQVQYIKIVGTRTTGAKNFITARMFNFYEDTTVKVVAKFSFDGENAGKIILEDAYKNINWKYSIDGGENWKDATGDSCTLTENEIEQINENDNIKILFEGDETEYKINIKRNSAPNIAYANDWENRVIGLNNTNTLEWKYEEDSKWTSYEEKEPIVEGDKTLLIRTRAKGIYAASEATEYEFTVDNYPETEKYVLLKHIASVDVSSTTTGRGEPGTNAIDGMPTTMWHSNRTTTTMHDPRWIVLELDEPRYISKIEYIRKAEYAYGIPKNGKVSVSMDGENWTEVLEFQDLYNPTTSAELIASDNIKELKMSKIEQAKYVKIECTESCDYVHGERDGVPMDYFFSAAMINLFEDTTKNEEPDNPVDPDEPIFTSEKYSIEEKYVSKILPETTVKQFKENVETNQELTFVDKNGNALEEDSKIGTGAVITVGEEKQYILVVTGDTNGDGSIGITDLAQIKLHYIESTLLTDARLKAADMNGDGKISITDLAKIKLVIIGKSEIE